MSYLVLARKYRPQTFSQVIEQDHVTRTLSNAISSNRVAHAVLFSGPRGTGKTTVARILAKAMNCQQGPTPSPCNQCRSCREITSGNAVDVFEIDGASNNSVDQVRELREHIKYMPAHSTHKIYIIDEVHMLSVPAFNALLKTLEEPPPHIMFIFATTEPQKIPITILSRCQRHDFRRISLKSLTAHMAYICQQEDFKIPDESLTLIAREATGSMRDALSLLDQILSCYKGAASHDQVLEILGVIDRKYVFDIGSAILHGDIAAILDALDDCYHRGHDLKKLYSNLLEHFRNLLVVKMGKNVNKLVDLPDAEVDQMIAQIDQVPPGTLSQIFDHLYREEASIRLSADTRLALEMAFIRMDQMEPLLPIDVLIDKLDLLKQEFSNPSNNSKSSQPPVIKSETSGSAQHLQTEGLDSASEPLNSVPGAAASSGDWLNDLGAVWDKLSKIIAETNPSLGASLSKCRLRQVAADRVEIEVHANGFTVSMLQREKNKAVLKKVCAQYFGNEKDIVLIAQGDSNDEGPKKKSQNDHLLKKKALSHPAVVDALEIFNGKLIDVKIR
jgi:DNA polymerase III subunit gamma/tau